MTGVTLITRDTAFGRHVAARMAAALVGNSDPLSAILVLGDVPASPPFQFRIARALRLNALRRLVSRRARQNHRVWRLQSEADAEFARGAGPTPDWPTGAERHHVLAQQVNQVGTIGWLRSRAPRLLVVAGSPILSADLLAVPRDGALNMHSSLLPRYRGTRAEFWQVHNGDLECAGVTIHFVDSSVDGGDIIRRHPLNPTSGDSPWLMRVRNQLNGLVVYPETVCAVLDGRATSTPQLPEAERAYRHSDITPEAMRTVLEALGQTR